MFERYAIFYTPTGGLADFGAAWLGWDSAAGLAVPHPPIAGVDVARITARPRRYGMHGTLKAPFRPGPDVTQHAVKAAATDVAARLSAFDSGTLTLRHQNGFVALRPAHDCAALREFAGALVTAFDGFRAPLTPADIARRRTARLTERQDSQLCAWGYPFVFDDFNFHLTLTGPLPRETADDVIAALRPHLDCVLDRPLRMDAFTLMGEDGDGLFHQIHRYALTG